MASRLNAASLVWVGVLAGAGYYAIGPSSDEWADRMTPRALQPARLSGLGVHVPSTPQGAAFPWLAADSSTQDGQAQAGGSPHQKLEGLLQRYQSGAALPDEKKQIQLALQALNRDPLGRSLMIELLTSSGQAAQAQALYGLISDADLKDVTLLEDLIQRDRGVFDLVTRVRILDLIADLEAQPDAAYSSAIDQYLAQLAQSRDAELRQSAASQQIWYMAHHQPERLATLGAYLQDASQRVREEMYSMLEARMTSPSLAQPSVWTLALNATLGAEHLRLSTEEKARVGAMLAMLQHP